MSRITMNEHVLGAPSVDVDVLGAPVVDEATVPTVDEKTKTTDEPGAKAARGDKKEPSA